MERRFASDPGIKTAGRGLTGYAAVFDTEAPIGGAFIEKIARGAFAASLASSNDILALKDHDSRAVLARTRSGTLKLEEDERGLRFDLDLPDTSAARDVLALAEAGSLGGMSIGFISTDESVEGSTRIIRAAELIEISVISAWPAYGTTSVQARSAVDGLSYGARVLKLVELKS